MFELLSASTDINYRNVNSFSTQVGTSSVVYPAAMFAPQLAARGVTVGEFNIEETDVTDSFGYGNHWHVAVHICCIHICNVN